MLNKHEGNLLLVSALVCIPMLLLQGVLLAPPASPLTLLLVLMTTLTGFALLLFLTHSVRRGEKARQEQRWLLALQQRDPAMLDSVQAQTALRQLLASMPRPEPGSPASRVNTPPGPRPPSPAPCALPC